MSGVERQWRRRLRWWWGYIDVDEKRLSDSILDATIEQQIFLSNEEPATALGL